MRNRLGRKARRQPRGFSSFDVEDAELGSAVADIDAQQEFRQATFPSKGGPRCGHDTIESRRSRIKGWTTSPDRVSRVSRTISSAVFASGKPCCRR